MKVLQNTGSIQTHFPKDKNCEICMRTKITRALCKKRTGTAVLRAEKFGDLIPVDQKVLCEGCESRTIIDMLSWYTIWQLNEFNLIRAKPKLFRKQKRAYKSSWSRRGNQKSFTLTINSLEFGKACEDLSWNRCTSTPHRSETNAIAERAVRRIANV